MHHVDYSRWGEQYRPDSWDRDPAMFYNSYFVVQVEGDAIFLIAPQATPCRDTFLNLVDTKLRTGESSELVIALFMENPVALTTPGGLYLDRVYPAYVENTAVPMPQIVPVKVSGDSMTVCLFTITAKNYFNPAYFWLLTQNIRYTLTGFSKVDIEDSQYCSPSWDSLLRHFKTEPLPPLVIDPLYNNNRSFYDTNSPLGLITLLERITTSIAEHSLLCAGMILYKGGSGDEVYKRDVQRSLRLEGLNYYQGLTWKIPLLLCFGTIDVLAAHAKQLFFIEGTK